MRARAPAHIGVLWLALASCDGDGPLTAAAGQGGLAPGTGGTETSGGGSGGATGGTSSGAAGADAGAAGDAGASTSTAGSAGTIDAGAAGQGGAPGCPIPPGESVAALPYAPPASAAGCNFTTPEQSVTLAEEAEFLALFACPAEAASGIDFSAQRLHVTVIREAGFAEPALHHAVALSDGSIELGFELPVYCGGAFPPTAVALRLLPAATSVVSEIVCRTGDCGAGGFPP